MEDYILPTRNIRYVTGDGYKSSHDLAGPTGLSCGTTPAFGTWGQAMAVTTEDDVFVGITALVAATTADMLWLEYEMGIGASGVEVPIWQWMEGAYDYVNSSGFMQTMMTFWPRGVLVKAGQRVSLRVASGISSLIVYPSLCYVRLEDIRMLP